MNLQMLEGVVSHGQVKLPPDVCLPDNFKVYVLVPDAQIIPTAYIYSPRLKNPAQAADFMMEVLEEQPNAAV
jgi:hypothetical protein